MRGAGRPEHEGECPGAGARVLLEVSERLAPRRVERDAEQLQLGVGQLRRQQPLERRQRQDLHLSSR